MEYSVQNLSSSKIEIALSVSKEEWDSALKKAYDKNKYRYTVEGFRKGRAPMGVLLRRYGKELFYEDALDESLSRNYSDIIVGDKIEVVGEPAIDLNEISEDGYKAVITVAVKPDFELGEYKGLTFTEDNGDVSDEELEKAVEKEIESRARLIEKADETVETGNVVVLNYRGKIDGVEFDGGTADNQRLEIGSGSFVPGFEEQLVGLKKGGKRDVKITFPKDYNPDLAGKDAVFEVDVKEVYSKELPVPDDEFVKDVDDELNTVEEWKNKIRKNLSAGKLERAAIKLENEMIDAVVKNTEVDIPECMVEEELDSRIRDLERNITAYGLKFDDYLRHTGATVDSLKAEMREEAARDIKSRLVIEAIVKKENIEVLPEEIDSETEKLTDEQKKNPGYSGYIANKLLIDKLFAFLRANNNINGAT